VKLHFEGSRHYNWEEIFVIREGKIRLLLQAAVDCSLPRVVIRSALRLIASSLEQKKITYIDCRNSLSIFSLNMFVSSNIISFNFSFGRSSYSMSNLNGSSATGSSAGS